MMARRDRGFTLLEVMVALAIIAMALMALSDLGGSALRNHAYASQLSQATLLARGKLAELEDAYEDTGFKDFDQSDEGDFDEQGHADIKWRVELKKPEAELSSEQLLAFLTGAAGDDAQGVLEKLMGLGSTSGSGGSQSAPASLGVAGAVMSNLIKTQLTAFGEQIKKSLREMRLIVSWADGRQRRQFTVVTHLLVLNPRAPGGARGESPDVPPGISAPRQLSPTQQPTQPGAIKSGGK
jgi:general secretion pathway protein I